jgi:NTP pyrophosphatase (non-canonical NTP hydrolase)
LIPVPRKKEHTEQVRYDQFVRRLFKVMPDSMMKTHAALGVCGEAGELADAIKKEVIYGKDADRNNIVEELGDLRFYIQAVQQLYGISEQEILQHNANKLGVRYKGLVYSDSAARDRADKNGTSQN